MTFGTHNVFLWGGRCWGRCRRCNDVEAVSQAQIAEDMFATRERVDLHLHFDGDLGVNHSQHYDGVHGALLRLQGGPQAQGQEYCKILVSTINVTCRV